MNYTEEFKHFAIKDQGISSLNLERGLTSMYPVGMTPNIIEERQLNAIAMDDVLESIELEGEEAILAAQADRVSAWNDILG